MRIGLLPRSFVPDVIIPELRKLTRQQKHYNIGTFLISLLRQSKKNANLPQISYERHEFVKLELQRARNHP